MYEHPCIYVKLTLPFNTGIPNLLGISYVIPNGLLIQIVSFSKLYEDISDSVIFFFQMQTYYSYFLT